MTSGEKTEYGQEEHFNGICFKGDDILDIQIKEEPLLHDISKGHNGDDYYTSLTGSDAKPSRCDAPETDFAVKDEVDPWMKEEKDSDTGSEEGSSIGNITFKEEHCSGLLDFYPCQCCDVSFTDLGFLEKHMKWVHPKQYRENLTDCLSALNRPKHNCTECNKTFKSKVALNGHIREAHPSPPPRRLYPCPTCARSFQYLKNLKNHCQSVHSMSVTTRGGHLSCGNCKKSFKNTWGQGPHLCNKPNNEDEDKPICLDTGVKCSECGKIVGTPQSLEVHMRTHTGARPFVCKDCGKRFVERSAWSHHMKIHSGEKPFKCQVCGKRFRRSGQLNYHLTTHTGKKEYSCPQCGKEFGLKATLNQHIKIHSDEKPFTCSVCKNTFRTQRNLRVHSKSHSSEKAHQCGECGIKIRDMGAFKAHLRTHTGERPYHCTVCGSSFIRLHHLRNHQRTHTGEKPYKCNQCDMSFAQSGSLANHKNTHSGEKPYKCPDCPKCYNTSGDLGKHRRSHTDFRPHKCQECGKGFYVSGSLKTHMLTHTGEKPYSCPICHRRFARSHHLSGHVARCR